MKKLTVSERAAVVRHHAAQLCRFNQCSFYSAEDAIKDAQRIAEVIRSISKKEREEHSL